MYKKLETESELGESNVDGNNNEGQEANNVRWRRLQAALYNIPTRFFDLMFDIISTRIFICTLFGGCLIMTEETHHVLIV